MLSTLDINDNVQQAHRIEGTHFHLPFSSFADLFIQRVTDPQLVTNPCLTYYDDNGISRTYTYAEFGDIVGRTITFLREHLGVQPGDRIATALFNHDSHSRDLFCCMGSRCSGGPDQYRRVRRAQTLYLGTFRITSRVLLG